MDTFNNNNRSQIITELLVWKEKIILANKNESIALKYT